MMHLARPACCISLFAFCRVWGACSAAAAPAAAAAAAATPGVGLEETSSLIQRAVVVKPTVNDFLANMTQFVAPVVALQSTLLQSDFIDGRKFGALSKLKFDGFHASGAALQNMYAKASWIVSLCRLPPAIATAATYAAMKIADDCLPPLLQKVAKNLEWPFDSTTDLADALTKLSDLLAPTPETLNTFGSLRGVGRHIFTQFSMLASAAAERAAATDNKLGVVMELLTEMAQHPLVSGLGAADLLQDVSAFLSKVTDRPTSAVELANTKPKDTRQSLVHLATDVILSCMGRLSTDTHHVANGIGMVLSNTGYGPFTAEWVQEAVSLMDRNAMDWAHTQDLWAKFVNRAIAPNTDEVLTVMEMLRRLVVSGRMDPAQTPPQLSKLVDFVRKVVCSRGGESKAVSFCAHDVTLYSLPKFEIPERFRTRAEVHLQ